MTRLLLTTLLLLCTSCNTITESVLVLHAWSEFIGEAIECDLKQLAASRPE